MQLTCDLCDSAPNKVKPAFPSGLVNNWQAKLNDKKLKAPSSKSMAAPWSNDEKIGGLADKDSFTNLPPPLGKSQYMNQNNKVSIYCSTAISNLMGIGNIACCSRN